MANRIPRSRFPRSVKRATTWVQAAVMAETSIGAASTKVLLQRLTAASIAIIGAPTTVVRTRGNLIVRSDQIIATEIQNGAFGMAVVSEEAAVAGAASIPGPVSEASWDGWFLWFSVQNVFSFTSGVGTDSQGGRLFEFDSKAMRKVEDNESVVVMYESGANSDGQILGENFRQLYKLH